MEPPKVIKGWLGWAVIGNDGMVYARTRAEALHRWAAKFGHDPSASEQQPVIRENVEALGQQLLADGQVAAPVNPG